jgi:tetratricopeptide (TPR) repeat protein
MSQDPHAERRVALQNALIRRMESVTMSNRAEPFRLEPFLEPDAVEEIRELTALLDDDDDNLRSRFLLGWAHWYHHIGLPQRQDQSELADAVEMFIPWFVAGREPQTFPGELRPALAGLSVRIAEARLEYLKEYAADLDRIASVAGLWQRIVAATPESDPDLPQRLTNLANALMTRHERTGERADLDEAISHLRRALVAVPVGDPNRAYVLTNLGGALIRSFGDSGHRADLDEAIGHLRDGLALTVPDDQVLPERLSNLASALQARFERVGELTDLDEAVVRLRQAAAAMPAGSPNRAGVLDNLGTALRARFDRTAVEADLDQSIRYLHEALTVATPHDPDRVHILNNYGNALETRFERTGALGDLDDAITHLQEAATLTPLDHPERKDCLSNTANALRTRFDRLGVQADLDEAVSDLRLSVAATPPDSPDWPGALSNLAASLLTQFWRTGVPADLDEAISSLHQALFATPADHPDRPGRLSNLAVALQSHFHLRGTVAAVELDEAVASLESAMADVTGDDPRLVSHRFNLASVLLDRFDRAGARADLATAIAHLEAVTAATAADHPDQANYLSSLGLALCRTGTPANRDQAAGYLERAANVTTAAPSLRIRAARTAADLTWESEPSRAAGLLNQAALLLPTVAPRRQSRTDQQYALGGFAGLAADAAALTLADPARPQRERAELALQLLETGRAVLIGQALQVRSDLSDLTTRHPQLADRFSRLRDLLDAPGGASDRVRLSGELEQTLDEIHAQPGFGTFALPPAVDELVAEAEPGPVVVFNTSRVRSDALLVTADGVTSLPLPGLDYETVVDRVSAFHQALGMASSGRTSAARRDAQRELREVLEWLWENGVSPVLDALGYRAAPAPGEPRPRVWWAPGGLLSLLPIHAADETMDRVVSSYTFTIASLRHTRQHPPSPDPAAALIVAMPTTPGIPGQLEYVPDEARKVAAHLPHSITLIEPGPADSSPASSTIPTAANVLELLRRCSIAHFACHGTTDPADPDSSRLLLHDHLTVGALASLNLAHAQLAYLSACNTAVTTDTRLLDEAIHLASAFQLAGYRHVIGTLWTARDERAVEIADAFYAALADITPAAALHHAVQTQRDQFPQTPSLWAAYLHVGA